MAEKKQQTQHIRVVGSIVLVVVAILLLATFSGRNSQNSETELSDSDSCAGYLSTAIETGLEVSYSGGIDSNLQLIVEESQEYQDYESRYSCRYVALSHYTRSFDSTLARETLNAMKPLDVDSAIFEEWGIQPETFEQLEERVVFVENFNQSIQENGNGGLPVLNDESRP